MGKFVSKFDIAFILKSRKTFILAFPKLTKIIHLSRFFSSLRTFLYCTDEKPEKYVEDEVGFSRKRKLYLLLDFKSSLITLITNQDIAYKIF